jgi:hypothetical protein
VAFEDHWLREGNFSPLEWERKMYVKTQNSLHVWQCIQICCHQKYKGQGFPGFPDWVIEYLEQFSKVLGELYLEHHYGGIRNLPSKIAAALGFKEQGQGVRATAFSDGDLERRNLRLATKVWRYLREHPGSSALEACTSIAEDYAERAALFARAQKEGRIRGIDLELLEHENVIISEEVIADAWSQWRDFVQARHEQQERGGTTSPK